MRGSLLLVVSCLLIVEILPASGQAQLFDGGADSLRAPYAVAQRRGRLRERLRSRFRQEEEQLEQEELTPLQRQYPGALTPPPVPPAMPLRSTARQVPAPSGATVVPDRQSLETSLILADAELDRQLNASSSADAYRKYLRVGRLSELLLQNPGTSLTEESRQELQQILDIYDRTRVDPRQRRVSRLSGFQRIQSDLTQLLARAEADDPGPESFPVEGNPPQLLRQPSQAGGLQPTQVLPSVRESY